MIVEEKQDNRLDDNHGSTSTLQAIEVSQKIYESLETKQATNQESNYGAMMNKTSQVTPTQQRAKL